MKKRLLFICVAMAAAGMLLALGGCSQPAPSPNNNPQGPSAQKSDERVSYEGKTLSVTLEENATTGYLWSFTIDGSSLVPTGDEVIASASSKDSVGAPTKHVFRFEGVSEGTAVLTFTYARSWEKTDEDKVYKVTVKTASDGSIKDVQTEDVTNPH